MQANFHTLIHIPLGSLIGAFISKKTLRLLLIALLSMAAKFALKVGSRSVPLVAASDKINLQHVADFKPLQDWAKALAQEEDAAAQPKHNLRSTPLETPASSAPPLVKVNKVEVRNVEYFGGERVGFANLAVDAELSDSGKKPPGLIFMVLLLGLVITRENERRRTRASNCLNISPILQFALV